MESATGGDHFVEDTYLAPQFGMLEFLRRLREDQLSVLGRRGVDATVREGYGGTPDPVISTVCFAGLTYSGATA